MSVGRNRILEIEAIEMLVERGLLVVCAGGGGIPVVRRGDRFEGIAAVIDKDRTSALLAEKLACDALIILADCDGVFVDFKSPSQRKLDFVDASKNQDFVTEQLPVGSMRPKFESGLQFVRSVKGSWCGIGRLDDLAGILEGTKGTRIAAKT